MGWMLIKPSASERQCPLNTASPTQASGTTSAIAMHIRASLKTEVWHHGKLGESYTPTPLPASKLCLGRSPEKQLCLWGDTFMLLVFEGMTCSEAATWTYQ